MKDRAPRLFVVSAPSGAGKTSLLKAIVQQDPKLRVSVSQTTRPRRASESDGVHYHFVDEPTFEAMVAAGEVLEHARVFDNRYGTARGSVETMLRAGTDVILEIDWQGAQQVRSHWGADNLSSIFILPPSRAALVERLRVRDEDDDAVIERRTLEAAVEISHYAEFDHVVVNDDFDTAVADLQAIVDAVRGGTEVTQPDVSELVGRLLGEAFD